MVSGDLVLAARPEGGGQQRACENQRSQVSKTGMVHTHSFTAAHKPLPRIKGFKGMNCKTGYIL